MGNLTKKEKTATAALQRVSDITNQPCKGAVREYDLVELLHTDFVIRKITKAWRDDVFTLRVWIQMDGADGVFFTRIEPIFSKLLQCWPNLPLRASIVEKHNLPIGYPSLDIV